jgi:uncharacterized membrane protein YheB (UPF0754 family)
MTLFEILAPPLIGFTIAYGTNLIAIKMLFRPRKKIMIGRFHVPFTPGVVPKRKDQLAGVLGKAITDRFWGLDDLESVFTSDIFKSAVTERVMVLLSDPDTKLRFLDPDQPQQNLAMQNLKDELCVRIQAAILRSDLKRMVYEQSRRFMNERLGGGILSKVLNEKTISLISDRVADAIKRDVLKNGRSIVMPLVEGELRDLSREPLSDILNELIPDKDAQREMIGDTYTQFMDDHVRPIVESIDIGGMITEKVQQMNPVELEELTLSVVSRELRYVIILGGFIGAIIGAVNIFI